MAKRSNFCNPVRQRICPRQHIQFRGMPACAGANDKNVDRTETLDRLFDQTLAVFRPSDVSLAGERIATSSSYLIDYAGSTFCRRPIVYHHTRTLTGKRQRSATANPFSCGTCNNSNSGFHVLAESMLCLTHLNESWPIELDGKRMRFHRGKFFILLLVRSPTRG